MRLAGIGISFAAALTLGAVTVQPARADGGLTVAIIAGVVAVASIKCTVISVDKSTVESLCWLTPFGWIQPKEQKVGNVELLKTEKRAQNLSAAKTKYARANAPKRDRGIASKPVVYDRLAAVF